MKIKKIREWSPHKYLVSAARKTWRWSPERTSVLKRVHLDKLHWQCEKCGTLVTKIDYVTKKGRKRRKIDGAVDHIAPVGKQPRDWDEYPDYYRRMFCGKFNLQFLCTECHAPKSQAERKAK